MLRIFKGDDTAFANANRIRITIGTGIPLSGCRAEFELCGVKKQIADVSTGTFNVAFTADETASMPLGTHCATIRVFDAQGRQRTTTNTLRVEVTDIVDMAYSGGNAADVDGHLIVKGVVDDGYGVPADLPEDYTPDEMRAFLNRLAALLRNSMIALLGMLFLPAMGAEVEYARFGSMKATANVVTNVDLSAKADATNVYTKTEADARIVELAPVPDLSTNNAALVATIEAKAPPTDISGKQDRLPYETNAIPYEAISGTPDLSEKQDALPYPTNEIPQAAISGLAQSMSTKQDALPYSTNAIPYSVITNAPAETDPTVPAWAKAETPPQTMTTNDVCNIVTNETQAAWSVIPPLPDGYMIGWYVGDGGAIVPSWVIAATNANLNNAGEYWVEGMIVSSVGRLLDPNATELVFVSFDNMFDTTFTATYHASRNALGFARLVDLPPLTNGLVCAEKSEKDGKTYNVIPSGYRLTFPTDDGLFFQSWYEGVLLPYYNCLRPAESVPVEMTWLLPIDPEHTTLSLVSNLDLDKATNGLAKASDIPSTNGFVTAAVTNGIPESIASNSVQIAQVEQTVNTWEGYWDGTNIVLEVTNYYGNTSGELPRLRIKEFRDGGWTNVWDEARKFAVCESNLLHAVSASNAACRAACSAELAEGLSTRAPLAWGTYTDKGTTNVVGNSVWMTSPETYFAGGTEYQRVAVGSGTVCVLVDNGALAKTAGEPGTFRFQDDGGTNYFGFAKSDSYTIGCRTDGITVEGTLITLRYDVIMGGNDVPIVYWREFLDSGSWVQLNNSDGTAADGSPYTVTWYTSGGSYFAAINCGENATGFFKAETSVAGDVVFETNMKFRAGGGIECTNTAANVMGVIKPVYNGSSVTWTWSVK